MSTPTNPISRSYLGPPYGLAAWLLTKDHKRIAMLYLLSITIFFAGSSNGKPTFGCST